MGQFTSLAGPFIAPPTVAAMRESDETLVVLTVGPDSAPSYARLAGFTASDDPEGQGTWSSAAAEAGHDEGVRP